MKKMIFALVAVVCSACVVDPATAVEYAHRAHPECDSFQKMSHHYGNNDMSISLTEVSMKCNNVTKSIVIKCQYGMGVVSDTVCYENN